MYKYKEGENRMTFSEFVKEYNGKSFDYDGVAEVQCVDLIKMYLDKVFNIKAGPWGNAKDYYLNFEKLPISKYFRKIKNTASFIPVKGDICVWGLGLNVYGHIAIATGEGDTRYFYSYDLNWGSKNVKKVLHSYRGFLGVLRYKENLEEEEELKTYKNGSTIETVYADSNCTIKIGELDRYEECQSFGIVNDRAIVLYNVNNTENKKIGFVKYKGRSKIKVNIMFTFFIDKN